MGACGEEQGWVSSPEGSVDSKFLVEVLRRTPWSVPVLPELQQG